MFSIDRRGLQKRGSPSFPPRSKTQFFFISPNNIYSSLPILDSNQSLLVSTIVNKIYFVKIDILW